MNNINDTNIKPSHAKEFFLYLLSTAMFFVGMIALVTLGFSYIEYFIPDPAIYYSALSTYGAIHISIAILIVVFPVYIIVQRSLLKDIVNNPEIKNLRIRKWLLWLTFFIASLTLIIDGITIIYNFLTGDLTLQFGLKLALVASTAFFSLAFVRAEIKDYFDNAKLSRHFIAIMATIKILVIIFVGFYITGGPTYQRSLRIDQQTITNLDIIYSHINGYYIDKGALPTDKEALIKSINTFVIDDAIESLRSGEYSYSVVTSKSFELCANFVTETESDPQFRREAFMGNNWSHPKGQYCFSKEVIEPIPGILPFVDKPVKIN